MRNKNLFHSEKSSEVFVPMGLTETELEKVLTDCSLEHVYLMLHFEGTSSVSERLVLQEKIEENRSHYFAARQQMFELKPSKLQEIEEQLRAQKLAFSLPTERTIH